MSNEEKNFSKNSINWYPGHMVKAKREIKEKIDLIDIVYEVIDARMPISSRIPLDDLIENKKRIVVVTKYDLCDKAKTDKYLDEIKKEYPVLVYDLKNTNQKDINNLINLTNDSLKEINETRRKKGLKPRIFRALVVGAPNVGKSTLINRIRGKNVLETGNRAGVTKGLSWIRIGNTIELMDTPGILYPKITSPEVGLNLASFASINEDILNKEEIATYILEVLFKNYPDILNRRYNLKERTEFSKIEILEEIAKNTNSYLKESEIDYNRVYTIKAGYKDTSTSMSTGVSRQLQSTVSYELSLKNKNTTYLQIGENISENLYDGSLVILKENGKAISENLENYLTIKIQNSSMDIVDTISSDAPETYTITYTIEYKGYINSISNKIVIRE